MKDAAYRVLQVPSVADKTFLVTIGDRTVGGIIARDPMVGPWQVPVADAAVTLMAFDGYAGEAMAMGERTPLALIDAPASGRMAVGEAITNIAAAGIAKLGDVKLSANWMAPAGHPGEDAALYDTVRAVAMELCPALGISIPVGKDSMSMRTTWQEGGVDKAVTAPLSLIVSAFAPVPDARRALTPLLAHDVGETALLWIDLSAGRLRLGGSALAQAYGQLGHRESRRRRSGAPRRVLRDDPGAAARRRAPRVPRHWRWRAIRDAGRDGVRVALRARDRAAEGLRARCRRSSPRSLARSCRCARATFRWWRRGWRRRVSRSTRSALRPTTAASASCMPEPRSLDESRIDLHRAWSATTHALQRLRDNPDDADQEYERIADERRPGARSGPDLRPGSTTSPHRSSQRGARPTVAVLREQGVNGHVEMAAAFDRAGFDASDVHMSDVIAGRRSLSAYRRDRRVRRILVRRCARGRRRLGQVDPVQSRARATSSPRSSPGSDTFALGVCNGCQMMSNLHELIPGTAHWPHFVRNRSEQFEARFVLLEVMRSPSLFFRGMEGSRIPVATAHGEGYAEFRDAAQLGAAQPMSRCASSTTPATRPSAIRTMSNGSPQGITGLTTADGRFTILMPHPERGIPHRADVVASEGLGRGLPVDADVQERARVVGLNESGGSR